MTTRAPAVLKTHRNEGRKGVSTQRRKNEIEERRLEKKRKRGDMRRDRRRLAAAAPIKP